MVAYLYGTWLSIYIILKDEPEGPPPIPHLSCTRSAIALRTDPAVPFNFSLARSLISAAIIPGILLLQILINGGNPMIDIAFRDDTAAAFASIYCLHNPIHAYFSILMSL